MDEVDRRELKTFERKLGLYSAAGAICSYGNVIDFVEDRGVVIIDTCGHDEEYGRDAAIFLREQIEKGWGREGDAAENLEELGRRMHAMKDLTIPKWERDTWFEYLSASYTQVSGERISLAMGGGLGQTFVFRKGGKVEKFWMRGGTIDDRYLQGHDPAYNTVFGNNEMMLLSSDGLYGNIAKHFYFDLSGQAKKNVSGDPRLDYTDAFIASTLAEKYDQSAEAVRDNLVDKLAKHFMPQSLRDDDVTFVVIKKTS